MKFNLALNLHLNIERQLGHADCAVAVGSDFGAEEQPARPQFLPLQQLPDAGLFRAESASGWPFALPQSWKMRVQLPRCADQFSLSSLKKSL